VIVTFEQARAIMELAYRTSTSDLASGSTTVVTN
jgi:hypothetical protein